MQEMRLQNWSKPNQTPNTPNKNNTWFTDWKPTTQMLKYIFNERF